MTDENNELSLSEKQKIEDDRIFLGAAVIAAQRLSKSMTEEENRTIMRWSIEWAAELNDAVHIRRSKIKEVRNL